MDLPLQPQPEPDYLGKEAMNSQKTLDVRSKKNGDVFEAEVTDYDYKIVISTVKRPGWRSVHKQIAQSEETPTLWITHIENGVVTTTWEA